MFTTTKLHNNKCTKTRPDFQYAALFKDIMQPYLPMDRQAQEKPTPWRALDTICMMIKEALYLAQFKIFSGTFSLAKIKM